MISRIIFLSHVLNNFLLNRTIILFNCLFTNVGSVLIFEHPILHEGSKLISGRKYAIRTDVMYSSKVIRSHKDNESSTKEMTSQDIQNQLEELEEERCKPS